jgi:NAD dependent epimerase/dehydratase
VPTSVLVTGAAGFIGSHLVERLVADGYTVRAFVHYNSAGNWYNLEKVPSETLQAVEVVAGDIADPFTVGQAVEGCEVVFHLAALIGIPYSYVAPASYVSTNVTGTLNVLQACRKHGVRRMVHTSTSEAYGTAQYVPIDEEHPLVGQSPYSATKIGADQLVESYWRSFDLPACIIRPFNTYGPRQSARAVIPTIITQALTGDTLKLGNLDAVRDLTYVEDTARGLIAGARSDAVVGSVTNLGTGTGHAIREIVEQVGKLLGKDLTVEQDPDRVRPSGSEVDRLVSNNQRARDVMGWSPQVDLEAGLAKTIDYIRENLAGYKPGMYSV